MSVYFENRVSYRKSGYELGRLSVTCQDYFYCTSTFFRSCSSSLIEGVFTSGPRGLLPKFVSIFLMHSELAIFHSYLRATLLWISLYFGGITLSRRRLDIAPSSSNPSSII